MFDELLLPSQATSAVFLIDASNGVEQKLLQEWVRAECAGKTIEVESIIAPISLDPDNIPVEKFVALASRSDNPWIIPVRVMWQKSKRQGSQPDRLRDLLRRKNVLMTDSRAARILRQEPERALSIAAKSASLDELKKRFSDVAGAADDATKMAEFIADQAALALDVAGRAITGSRYKVPLRVAKSLKNSVEFRTAVQQLSDASNTPLSELDDETDEIMQEMIATPSPFWIDLGSNIAKKLTSLAYDSEIVLNQDDLARTKHIVNNYPTAFLWTHKTHVDGMAMQKVLYENDFPAAHTFGGINMAFAGLGHASRRSGIIFIRRSFKNNPLYKLILRHYIGYLLKKRFPFSWAFEGTRSRVGKLMPPRYGLLKYLIEAAQTTKTRNLHIVPVAINYDVIGDASDFAREQSGETKRAESLSWFVGYVRGMRQPMGRIYLDFGKPVVLEDVPDAQDQLAISKIAFQVGVEVNKVTPITLTSIVTMVLLSTYPRALTTEELKHEISSILGWVGERQIRVSSDFELENRQQSEDLAEVLVESKIITRYQEGTVELFSISPEQHVLASYYRNTIVHYFVNKAITELALLTISTAEGASVDKFWREAERIRDLFKFEFFYSPSEEFRREIGSELERYDADWQATIDKGSEQTDLLLRKFSPLVAHATLMQFAEAYWIGCTVLISWNESEALDEKKFVSQCLSYGNQAYLQRRVRSKASVSKELFLNAFKLAANLELLENGPDTPSKRTAAQLEFRNIINRLERIRARVLPI